LIILERAYGIYCSLPADCTQRGSASIVFTRADFSLRPTAVIDMYRVPTTEYRSLEFGTEERTVRSILPAKLIDLGVRVWFTALKLENY